MRTQTRKIAALCAGALAYLAILYRFLSYCVLACPAYLGAALAGAVDRVARRNPPPLT